MPDIVKKTVVFSWSTDGIKDGSYAIQGCPGDAAVPFFTSPAAWICIMHTIEQGMRDGRSHQQHEFWMVHRNGSFVLLNWNNSRLSISDAERLPEIVQNRAELVSSIKEQKPGFLLEPIMDVWGML